MKKGLFILLIAITLYLLFRRAADHEEQALVSERIDRFHAGKSTLYTTADVEAMLFGDDDADEG